MRQNHGRRGGAMLEMAFYLPWIFFLFIGAVDYGFFAYALVSVENAARVGAMFTSASSTYAADSSGACTVVLKEVKNLPNIGTAVTSCGGSNPVSVTATLVTGPDGADASQVSVTYTSLNLVPIPGLMQKGFTWTRSVTVRLRS
jgi:Flp pilus assembly protein TadG